MGVKDDGMYIGSDPRHSTRMIPVLVSLRLKVYIEAIVLGIGIGACAGAGAGAGAGMFSVLGGASGGGDARVLISPANLRTFSFNHSTTMEHVELPTRGSC